MIARAKIGGLSGLALLSLSRSSHLLDAALVGACNQHAFATHAVSPAASTDTFVETNSSTPVPSSSSSFGMGIWARVAALATQHRAPDSSPVAVDIGSGQHATTLAQLGMKVVGNPFKPQITSSKPSKQQTPTVDLVLAASLARKDVGQRLAQAYSLLKTDGHLVACWNDRDLCHPITKALLKARIASASVSVPSPTASPSLQSIATTNLGTATATATSANNCSSAAGGVVCPVRGVSTQVCTSNPSADGTCAANYLGGYLDEEQHEYNATRHLLEGVVGANGCSLFRVVSFSILPNPLPLNDTPLPDALSELAQDLPFLPFETKMFILRKAS